MVRILRAELLRGRFPGGDGEGRLGRGDAAADVVDRVADDHDVAPFEAVAVDGRRALDRDRRKLLAVGRVAAERAEREVAVEIGRVELDARARLDVSGEQ